MKATALWDPVLAIHMRDVDRTLLRENWKLAFADRPEKVVRFAAFADSIRAVM